ncbi:recombinase family protein [Streptomyces sp. NPDC059525]|uniref:recombinase family protein n=1 Tax=Streptomyces sp. NPDC059525 TaxID=3346857 RepID=UPI0036A34789
MSKINHGPPSPRRTRIRSHNPFSLKSGRIPFWDLQYEMKRLGREAAELTALADHLTAHGLVLEMLAGPLPGIYDPTGPGKLLFEFFAAMAETERENIRESTLEGLDTAARKGKHGGRPSPTTCSTPSSDAARAASPSCRGVWAVGMGMGMDDDDASSMPAWCTTRG